VQRGEVLEAYRVFRCPRHGRRTALALGLRDGLSGVLDAAGAGAGKARLVSRPQPGNRPRTTLAGQ
jgi:hypothetical protein